ncbi:putative molybdenum carrier protein [Hymenobacter sp. 15J16-1T3B]|uniref:putative molybdenum carrier protein n=1 Tax=Hymenobacter sp. 15J16-1T3B TaxID=2886941 RepID=UPI001D12587E|nr:putative molybdenum carrier protein [Hymenobacter sp. 15J16-1T3B]MCC3158211.1 putative molybdenum carrier protein [Hymenobacter sp. 15J16-1T3B]
MASKILSFICHVPGVIPGAYPAVPTTDASTPARTAQEPRRSSSTDGGHFTAIYENERFVRFKYISNAS